MPTEGQKRPIAQDLRNVVADNLKRLMAETTSRQLEKRSGIGRRTIERAMKGEKGATLDTIQAIATALEVEPWQLLIRGEAHSLLAKVFAKPVPDARLGANWTRHDRRRPLIEGSGDGPTKQIPSQRRKIKSRV